MALCQDPLTDFSGSAHEKTRIPFYYVISEGLKELGTKESF